MRVEEAAWIAARLAEIDSPSPVLELGSSTLDFRTNRRPHIDRLIHAPLRARGVRIVHTDLKAAPGVDIAGDFYDPVIQTQIAAVNPAVILCCNMFEHVTDRAALARASAAMLRPGGHAIVTVPYSFPLHLDPIDTYFRPTPQEIAAMYPGFDLIAGEVVVSSSWGGELLAQPRTIPMAALRQALYLFRVWDGLKRWQLANHKTLWLFRPFKVSCAVLRKR